METSNADLKAIYRSKMDFVYLINTNISVNSQHRKRASEEIIQACSNVNANCKPICVSYEFIFNL